MQKSLKTIITICFTLVFSHMVHSQGKPSETAKPSGNIGSNITADPDDYLLPDGTPWYVVPDIERLRKELTRGTSNYSEVDISRDRIWAEKVVFGFDAMVDTYATIGDGRTDGRLSLYQGKVTNCSSCHAQGGVVPGSYPLFRTTPFYQKRSSDDPTNIAKTGRLYGNLGYNRDIITRIRDCGIHCAGGGQIPETYEDENGVTQIAFEMESFVLWTEVVNKGIYPGEGLIDYYQETDSNDPMRDTIDEVLATIPGARIPIFNNILKESPYYEADVIAGKNVYKRSCSSCHGRDGQGKWSRKGFTAPPLTGEASFTSAGGPYMVPPLAAFIKKQMPLSSPDSLTEQDALNVAAYITNMPNRETRWWQDYFFEHNPCGRPAFLPLDVGFTPVGYPFTPEQTKFGPWKEINTWLKSNDCIDKNPKTTPLLVKDFDTGFDEAANTFSKPTDTPELCKAVRPNLLFDRITKISTPMYSCDTYNNEYFEYIVNNGSGSPEIGLSLEDNFDGTWYSSYFDYINTGSDILLEGLTPEDVQQCRKAFEPPFVCFIP